MIGLAGCHKSPADTAPSQTVYRFGALFPLTGSNANVGAMMKRGVDLAVDMINASGQLKGAKLEAVYADSQANPTVAVSAFNQLIAADKVFGTVSCYSGTLLAIAPIATRNKQPLVNNGAVTPALAGASPYIFDTIPLITEQARATVAYAVKQRGLKDIALFYSSDDLGEGTEKVFAEQVKAAGGNFVGAVAFDPTSTQYRLNLAKLQSLHPQSVFLTSTSSATGNIISQASALGLKPVWLGFQAFGHADTPRIGGAAAEGAFYSTSSTIDPATGKTYAETLKLEEAYRGKYGDKPIDFTVYTSALSVELLAKALGEVLAAGKDVNGDNLRTVLVGIREFHGELGTLTFEPDGTVLLPIEIRTVRNGAFVHEATYTLDDLQKLNQK